MIYLQILSGLSFITGILTFIWWIKSKSEVALGFLSCSIGCFVIFIMLCAIAVDIPRELRCQQLAKEGHNVSSCITCQREIDNINERILHCERVYGK